MHAHAVHLSLLLNTLYNTHDQFNAATCTHNLVEQELLYSIYKADTSDSGAVDVLGFNPSLSLADVGLRPPKTDMSCLDQILDNEWELTF